MHFLPLLTRIGSVAEWSKALVLGTSLQGGVGSNPTTANFRHSPFRDVLVFPGKTILYVLCGSVAEWSKALVLGTSLFGGVGSNPTTIKTFLKVLQHMSGRGKGGKYSSSLLDVSTLSQQKRHH